MSVLTWIKRMLAVTPPAPPTPLKPVLHNRVPPPIPYAPYHGHFNQPAVIPDVVLARRRRLQQEDEEAVAAARRRSDADSTASLAVSAALISTMFQDNSPSPSPSYDSTPSVDYSSDSSSSFSSDAFSGGDTGGGGGGSDF